MRQPVPSACSMPAMLALAMLLLSCGQARSNGHADMVGFDVLVANAAQYAGQYVCTEGVHAGGSETSGLAGSTYQRDGYRYLTEPVIWLERADLQSRVDCIETETEPPFEYCQVVVCGTFETGGRYGHGAAYPYQLRGRDAVALPSPTAPPAEPPAALPKGDAPQVEPPPAILLIDGQKQVSGIGSYCWTEPAGEESDLAVCADMAGIPTAEKPLVVSPPFTATFQLAPEETPDELLLEVVPVTSEDEFQEWPSGWRGWAIKEGERYSLPLEREPTLGLTLEPGLYVLNLMGWWQTWGDASYGFLVEATAGATGVRSVSPILFSYHRDGATEVWTIDPTSGATQRRIRPAQTILDPVLSPDGQTVAYVHGTGDYTGVVSELWLMNRDGSNPRPLYVPPAEQSVLSRPAWEPEGKGIHFLQLGSEARSQLLRVPVHGGQPAQVLTDCLDFALSPDGNWLVSVSLDRQLAMWTRNGDRIADMEPLDSNLTDIDSLAISPSGELLAFRATEGDAWNLHVMDLGKLNVRRLTDLNGFHALEPSGGQVNGLAWTSDGSRLVYSVDGDPEQTGIWVVGIDTGARWRLYRWQEGAWATVQGTWPESAPPPPLLTVDENPVVADAVDRPGRLEYADRLGEDVHVRLEGLRDLAAVQKLAAANAELAPFGYRLEARADSEWDRAFFDLYYRADAEPQLAGLWQVWPVSVNGLGTDFVLAAENAPNAFPPYLMIRTDGVEPWDAEPSNWLPPVYAGDALARVSFTGFPTLTYQVELDDGRPELDGLVVYTGTAVAQGAYMPLRSFSAWDGHWVLAVDDRVIMDGQDLCAALGCDSAYGFTLIRGEPFYFFEQDGRVRISYAGRTLPHVYDRVFHNQCCEAAIHNPEDLGDAVVFHALWNGTWYLVEAGVYEGEVAGTYRYTAPEGWSFRYPMHWDRLDGELGFVQDTATGKSITFSSQPSTLAELESWLESEIARKLAASEADNSLAEPLSVHEEGALTVYHYAIRSRMEGSETLLRTTVLFDGQRRYELCAAIPPLSDEEYLAVIGSFVPVPGGSQEGE